MSYYKEHAKEFIEDTFNCDMSEQYHFFEKHLKGKGTILDIGFGSGRDSLYFKSKGYGVVAIDPEEEFVKHAKEIGLENVYKLRAEEIDFTDKFDGIWACASLLHVSSKEMNNVLRKCCLALKNGGVMYASFKYGDFEGDRNGRYYLDVNEKSFNRYLIGSGLKLLESTLSDDVRSGRNEKWLNIIIKKESDGKK